MSDPPPEINPYAPSVGLDNEPLLRGPTLEEEEVFVRTTLARTSIRWLVVCVISAVPSFFFGLMVTNGQFAGMIVGIMIFATGYTLVDYGTALWPVRRDKTMRRTLRITYGTRIAISILFPLGGYLDLVCGMITLTSIEGLTGEVLAPRGAASGLSFFGTVFTTLAQGVTLNLVLGIYGLLIYGIQWLVKTLKR